MSSVARGARLVTPSIFTKTFMLGIVGTLSAYLASWENSDRVRDSYLDKSRDFGDTFDFIIVGAGTAGAIIANRLSEKYKVLLLEAGGEPHPFQAVPLLSNYLLNYAELDWRHVTMPQKQAFKGSVQSRASISQGRGLGGSSNLDYMMYLKGHPKDFDSWAEMMEDPSWSYKSVTEYYKKLEQYAGPWAPENHGHSGELKIRPPAFTGLGDHFCKAAQSNGYKQTDLNSFFTEGCDVINYPTKRGYRDSVHSSFLKRVKDRWNLAIHKYAHVNKILIRGNNDTAYGVEYDRHGKTKVAYAKKEIIVAAGAIQTPKILMLSGIGPKSDLDSIGIPVKADLPVGKNLQDHLSVFLGPFFVDRGRSLDIDRDIGTGSVLSLAKDGGPLTTTGFQAAAVISSGLEKLHGGRNWPDLQLTMYGISHQKSVEQDLNHAYKLKKDLLQTYLEHSKGLDSFSIVVSGGRPKSTGTVKLLNRNPYAPLIVNPNYLDKIYDVVVMVDGLKKALRIVENSTLFYNELNARFTRQVLPGCETYRFRSDAYFECYVRTMSISLGNVAGTAPMGFVLNSKLQVKGIKALRVMDASVMPNIITTSTGAAVMMIAEKGADMLLKEWEGTKSEAGGLQVKDTNLVTDAGESLKALSSLNKPKQPQVGQQLNFNDLKQITKSMGSLAALLDPVAASSIQKNKYTGSFDLKSESANNGNGTAKFNPLDAIAKLTPRLKSQIGGLYQNLFADYDDKLPKTKPGGKTNSSSQTGSIIDDLKLPSELLGAAAATALYAVDDTDPLKLIQNMIKNSMKDLKNISAISSAALKSLEKPETNKNNNITLDEVFGIAEGMQDELEEYEIEEGQNITSSSTTTLKTPSTNATTTGRPTEKVTSYVTATTIASTTTRSSTTKEPFIDYSYQVLPVPLTKSKDVAATQQHVQTVRIHPSTIKVQPASSAGSFSGKVKSAGPELQKLKNLEALAQIQHETLMKLKQKHQPKQPAVPFSSSGQSTTPLQQYQRFRNPIPAHFLSQQNMVNNQLTSVQGQSASPSLSILPPPLNGKFPPPQFYQRPFPPSQPVPPTHPLNDPSRPPQRYQPNPLPGLLRPQPPPTPDPSTLKYAVNSIMNAKYAPPSNNPFAGILSFLEKSPRQEQPTTTENGVLKSLQLRANVDQLLHLPSFFQSQVSPIPITHRPTYPPPKRPSTTPLPPPPPPPMGPEELALMREQMQKDDGVFAPLKDAFQPIRNLMKSPLISLLPNPFRAETTTEKSLINSLLPSFLTSSMFSQRYGPLSAESAESQTATTTVAPPPTIMKNNRNPLSIILPRLLMNQSRLNEDISPEVFLRALVNLTADLQKPFVLEPSKSFAESQQQSEYHPENQEEKNKKLLGESISDILSQLQNHHFASISSNSANSAAEDNDGEDIAAVVNHSATSGATNVGINSANEILHMDYRRFPTTVKAPVNAATPKVRLNPPIEFHKSPWAKEPSVPTKNLHFKIKIV